MIGHDNECTQTDIGETLSQPLPFMAGNLTSAVQPHITILDLAEQAGAAVGDNGDEISAGLGIIVSLQADGTAMVFLWIEFHNCLYGEGGQGCILGMVSCIIMTSASKYL